jgi:predicted oxidoreductase
MKQASADIIVVGSGAAGASAAVEAASFGHSIIGLDAASVFGGTARLAGGGICVPGSELQRAQGVSDSVELALADLSANGNVFDRTWAETYFSRANEDVFEWLRSIGVDFAYLRHFESDSVPRFHRPRNGGAEIMARIWDYGGQFGLQDSWLFGRRITSLIVKDGQVRGVRCVGDNGVEEFHARAVIMAIGGFAASLDRIREWVPALKSVPRLLTGGGPGAKGEGIALLKESGALIQYLEDLYCYASGLPDYTDPTGTRGVVIRATSGWVWLNRRGDRFHDESRTISGNWAVPRLLDQEGSTAWAIFDSDAIHDVIIDDHYVPVGSETAHQAAIRHLERSSNVSIANNLRTLLENIGVEVEQALSTLDAWNQLLEGGAPLDPLTGRRLFGLKPLTNPPFYAAQLFPIARKSMGGVQTDLGCRVLKPTGGVIPGLYAAGELSGMGGGHVGGPKPLEGMMVGCSCFSGRIAGRTAANDLIGSTKVARHV